MSLVLKNASSLLDEISALILKYPNQPNFCFESKGPFWFLLPFPGLIFKTWTSSWFVSVAASVALSDIQAIIDSSLKTSITDEKKVLSYITNIFY